jgi:PAS domain S-box-containing protein
VKLLSHKKKDASTKETKYKNIQGTLQKENSILEEMLNKAENIHVVYLDRDFNFVRVNEAYAKTCGYKPEEMIGKNHFALYPGEEVEAIFKRVRDTGVPAQFRDKPFVFPDQPGRGVTYWDWTLKPVKDGSGKVEGLVFSLVETSDRKRAEEAIKQIMDRESFLADIIRKASVAFGVGYPDGRVGMVNHAFEELTGYTAEELQNIDWKNVLTPKEYQQFEKQKLEEMNQTKKPIIYEKEYIRKDGTRVFAELVVHPFFNDKGEVSHYFSFISDISNRKKAEETLQEQGVAISSAPDAIFSTDNSFVIKSWNKAAERIFGWTPEEVVGKASTAIFKIKYPTLNGVTRERASKQLRDTGFWKGEVLYHKKDGSSIPVSVSVSLVKDKDDNVTGTVAVVHDISKRKRRVEALRRSEWVARQRAKELEDLQIKLEERAVEVEAYATHMEQLAEERAMKLQDAERLAAIGATAGMVGHDIRNPLQAIMGDLYLIASDVASFPEGEEKENITESIAAIRKNIDYINKIIQDLQDYAKSPKPDLRRVNLEEIIQNLFVEIDFPESVDAKYCVEEEAREIVADTALVERIIRNLVINAVQAMPEGGKLDIQSRRENGEVVLTVEDSGIGIPADCKEKLFTPLFTTKAKGQGFGLAVVKRMTEALEGTVTFESEEGKGTKFIVRLPCTKIANDK